MKKVITQIISTEDFSNAPLNYSAEHRNSSEFIYKLSEVVPYKDTHNTIFVLESNSVLITKDLSALQKGFDQSEESELKVTCFTNEELLVKYLSKLHYAQLNN